MTSAARAVLAWTLLAPSLLSPAATGRAYREEIARWFALVKARGLAEKK